jgi:myosin heavy subunit
MDQPVQWIKSPKSLAHIGPYLKGRLIRPIQDHSLEFEIHTDRGPLRLALPSNSFFEAGRQQDYEDMCEMDILNEPEVLSNLIKRYKRDDIFTSIGPTLITLNPYRHIDRLFSRQVLE